MPSNILALIDEVEKEPAPAPSIADMILEVENEPVSGAYSRPASQDEVDVAGQRAAEYEMERQFGPVGGRILSAPVIRETRSGIGAGVKGIGQGYAQLASYMGAPGAETVAQDLGDEREALRAETNELSGNSMMSRVGAGVAEVVPQVAEMVFAGGLARQGATAVPRLAALLTPRAIGTTVGASIAARSGAANAEHQAREEGLTGTDRTNFVLRSALIEGGITALGGTAGLEAAAMGRQGLTKIKDGIVNWMQQMTPAAVKGAGSEILEENAVNLAQKFNEFASLPSNKGRPLSEVWTQWAAEVPETSLIAGIAGGGGQVMNASPQTNAPYELSAEESAALNAMAPDGEVQKKARSTIQTPPQEWVDIEKRAELDAVDPRMQALMDEEEEGASLPAELNDAAQAERDSQELADYEWKQNFNKRMQEGRQAARDKREATKAKDEQWRQHVGQQLRQRRTGETEAEQIPNPYEVEKQEAEQRQRDQARTEQMQRAEALRSEEADTLPPEQVMAPVASEISTKVPPVGNQPGKIGVDVPSTSNSGIQARARPVPGPQTGAKPTAVRVRSVADLDRGFREVYGLSDDESNAAIALVRARAAALGEDPDAYTARTISEVRQGKGAANSALYQEGNRVIPRDQSLEFDKLQKQWRKAHGDRTPVRGTKEWMELQRRAAKIDAANGILYQEDVANLRDAPQGRGSEKGAISFAEDGRAVLHALQAPDVSTAVHELGHSFRGTLPARDSDYAARWAGAKKRSDGTFQWNRPAEEKFARGFERYLRDGTAPTAPLRNIFSQLRDWLRHLYQSIKSSPVDVKLSPKIRAVFDRMLTPKDKTTEAQLTAGIQRDATTPKARSAEKSTAPEPAAPVEKPRRTTLDAELPDAPQSADKSESAEIPIRDRPPEAIKNAPKKTRETPLAIPAVEADQRKAISDLDKKRDTPETREQTPLHEQAERRVANDYAGERKRILAKATNGELLSDQDTAIAQELLRRDTQKAVATGSESDLRALAAMHAAYRDTGTEAGRSLAMRKDPDESPNKRRLRMVSDSILTPPKPLRDAMKKTRTLLREARDAGHAQEAANYAKRLEGLHVRAEKRLMRVRNFFKKEGIDLLYQGENADYIASMANAASKANGTMGGVLREYWINAILSGPRTMVVNATAVNAAWHLGVNKFAEAALNGLTGNKNPDASTMKEYRIMWKGLIPGIQRGWQNALRSFHSERAIFGEDLQDSTQFEEHGPQIKGRWGRIVRIPTRLLMAGDQFNKTWSANVEVMSQAYRLAKKQLGTDASEDALTKRTQELVADLESPAWDKAKESATEWAFQNKLPPALSGVYKLRDARLPGTDLRPIFYILPFVKTPTNLIRQGVAASPLGLARILWKIGVDKSGGAMYERSELAKDAAQQIVSFGISMGLMALAGLEDDDGLPYLTGSEGAYKKGKAGIESETMQPYTLRIPGTDVELDYRRIEPFATWFAMVADGTRIAKRAKNGQGVGDTFGQLSDAISTQVLDKSMLKSVSDIYNAMAPGGNSDMSYWAKNFATSWVPNVIRAPIRDGDNTVRETGVWGEGADYWSMYFGRIGRSVVPWTQHPRINLLGDEVTKSDGGPLTNTIAMMTRVVSPSLVTTKKDAPDLYRWLTAWNNDAKHKPWYPSPASKHYTVNGEKKFFTEIQYERLQREAGTLLKDALKELASEGNEIHVDKPTEAEQKMLSKLISRTRRAARGIILEADSASDDDSP